MKIINNSLMILLVLPLASFAQDEVVNNAESYSLTVKVDQLRNTKGVVQFSLYNKDGTIPDKKYDKYFKQLKAEITDGISLVTFTELPEGRYAVNILHDETKMEKLINAFLSPLKVLVLLIFSHLV